MKVLSIQEPYASLIKEGVKVIETRSWKTKYRGELYIHTSKKKVSEDDKCIRLLKDKNLKYGCIIFKCKLTDCRYMTEKLINDIRESNKAEYECGIYKEGRYAWYLTDIEVLKEPIYVNGHLGIWNYIEEENVK